MLTKLELSGFKSFAKKTTLEFGASISAVVGPNGSGKSNVAEALRWVLGEQSLKSLRGKRGEDLIWNGSREVVRSNHASVSIYFDNRGKKFNLDYDEVVISRHVYRDGTNEYSINGSQVRLKDIVELLASVGIGASSHHIISQGEADRILSASSVERREMIEDALGLKIFQYKRQESEKKLQKTEENVRQVEALRKEIQPHLKFLKKQVEKVEAAEKMREELLWLYRDYLNTENAGIEADEKKLLGRKDLPEEELARLEYQIKEIEDARKAEAAARGEGDKQRTLRDIENRLYNMRIEKDELSRMAGRLEGKIEALPVYKVMSGEEVCGACGQVIRAEAKERVEHREVELAKLKEERAALEEKIRAIRESETQLIDEHEKLKIEIDREQAALRGSERALFEAKSRRGELTLQLEAMRMEEMRVRERKEAFGRECADALRFLGEAIRDWKSAEVFSDPVNTPESFAEREEQKRKIERLKLRLEDVGGENFEVLKEYREVSEREAFLAKETEDLLKSAESLRAIMKDLEEKLRSEFQRGLLKINEQFNTFFSIMFGGGSASLELVREVKKRRGEDAESLEGEAEELGEEGIEIQLSLPRKKVRGLEMLSGGERALTSIALLFAVSQVNPPPFLVLDETDAALDESNSRRYGDMIETLAKYSQLVLITHNRETMSRASILYGVTMGMDGVSRILSVRFDQAQQYAK